ncbi:50S ribosomal protein L10 [Salisediminibacterium halotolerans]|uniref:Large ribosomal subunit protein uL10 n=1 Tax=Salisediminibacterium halotolerans TaxID=517425 RepID=A0A1H9UQR1_9BACI|nr:MULTISPECIES: 50S ribosomal protein L10 [Salisediminibacterium]RLJ73065.1 LSU ribosomal protein L10P [Actinophytocola xinjiangensis]RPE86487.1 LSU ribosomal protein L10P [Salisediminibacterium halotolerans]TWG33862.1 LSU ribosomal protein L10P [Salisediminibacterium halotolerans]SES11688.1 large subunit ribosomal protein L10 [Salisediminibacterium haloalkalitolerans]GEL07479.1 50S ribosomal protein L10 [Salisediminibacterium halotolerans]
MSAVIEQKQQVVDEITTKLQNSQSTIIVDYRGLDVAEVSELRRQLREAGVDYKVYKNTMVRRATEKTGLTELDELLVGPTAIAFSNDDVVAPAKVLNNFAKEHSALELKGGVVQGEVTSLAKIKELAEIPSQEGLLSMFLNVLQAPIRNMALATKAVADQKEESA